MMRRSAALVVGLVAVALTAAAWLQEPAHITSVEAVRAATGAFEAAGLQEASVALRALPGTYDAGDDSEPIRVWKTTAMLEDGTVELWLSRQDGEPVYLDDRTPDGAAQLLTDAQFEQIGDHFENPALGRQLRRNLLATLAAALILGVSVLLGMDRAKQR
jgi:hypothetical protein